MDYDVTGITTFCMNDKFIKSSLNTFRGLYPKIQVVVVDNSPSDHVCAKMLKSMYENSEIDLIANGENLGHGKGLTQAMERVKTKYVLVFDSDVEFININLLPDMFSLMAHDTYGVGFVMWLGYDGSGVHPWRIQSPRQKGAMKYLHPFCALLSIEQYKKFKPFDTYVPKRNRVHGAPMTSPMQSIHDSGKDYVIKYLPDSRYTKCKYWNHTSGGVRMILRERKLCQ